MLQIVHFLPEKTMCTWQNPDSHSPRISMQPTEIQPAQRGLLSSVLQSVLFIYRNYILWWNSWLKLGNSIQESPYFKSIYLQSTSTGGFPAEKTFANSDVQPCVHGQEVSIVSVSPLSALSDALYWSFVVVVLFCGLHVTWYDSSAVSPMRMRNISSQSTFNGYVTVWRPFKCIHSYVQFHFWHSPKFGPKGWPGKPLSLSE